jgi:hypothetical protein
MTEEQVTGGPVLAVGIMYGIFIIAHDAVVDHLGVAGLLYGLFHIIVFGTMLALERFKLRKVK